MRNQPITEIMSTVLQPRRISSLRSNLNASASTADLTRSRSTSHASAGGWFIQISLYEPALTKLSGPSENLYVYNINNAEIWSTLYCKEMKKQTIIEGWLKLVSGGYYTHALTLKPNSTKTCDFSDNVLFERLYRFHGLFDDALVGRRFYEEKNKHLRTQIIAVAEGNNDTGHLHCAIRVHETLLSKLNEIFPTDLTNAKLKAPFDVGISTIWLPSVPRYWFNKTGASSPL